MASFSFDHSCVCYQGARDYQEDSIITHFPIGQSFGYTVLADGMGGHLGGDIASEIITRDIFQGLRGNEKLLKGGTDETVELLRERTAAANASVKAYVNDNPSSYGMGATLLATVISGDRLNWISVGDSPLYLLRDGALQRLNADHSMAPQIDLMVKTGAMSEEAGRDHPDRNMLTSAISGHSIALIDCPPEGFELRPGDILVVATDGLQFIDDTEIERILQEQANQPSHLIAHSLLSAIQAVDDPDQDNATFAVLKIAAQAIRHKRRPAHSKPMLATVNNSPRRTQREAEETGRRIKLVRSEASFASPQIRAAEALREDDGVKTARQETATDHENIDLRRALTHADEQEKQSWFRRSKQ